MKSSTILTIIVFLFIGITITLLSFATVDLNEKKIESVKVKIENGENSLFLTEAVVRQRLDTYGQLIGELQRNINLQEIYNHIEDIASVRDLSVYMTLEGELVLSLRQRQPLARLNLTHGPNVYIDEDGLSMPLDPKHSVRVPIIHADNIEDAEQAMLMINSYVDDEFWDYLIDQIKVNSNGDLTILPRLGAPIFIGAAEDFDHKRTNLITFYREQIKSGNLKNYKQIDLSYRDQVIATRYAHLN